MPITECDPRAPRVPVAGVDARRRPQAVDQLGGLAAPTACLPSGPQSPPTKRQAGTAVCRNAGETGAKSGKTRTPASAPEPRTSPAKSAECRPEGRTTENCQGRVRIDPLAPVEN